MKNQLNPSDQQFIQQLNSHLSEQGISDTTSRDASVALEQYFRENLNLISKSSRLVYEMPSGNAVLKTGNPLQSQREAEVWQQYKNTEIGSLLVPTLYSNDAYYFNIQERAHGIGSMSEHQLDTVHEVFQEYGLNVQLRNTEEFGFIERQVTPVLVDYGELHL